MWIGTYAAEIERFAGRMLGNATDAEDVCQEVFTRAFAAYGRFDGAQPRPWLYRVAGNVCVDRLRRRKQEMPWPAAFDVAVPVDEEPAGPVDSLRLERLRDLIGTLPHRQREALCLRRLDGLDYAEVAARMGGTPDAARANVYQALRRLRRLWAATSAQNGEEG